ncbi:BAG family molecular chaperone regulator 4 [Neltuma alba]|uniref:BAG family molecular chaperone regulator 4 n=1 Tax=Neltuma alba TaxID=207710 RepID=UPI0010A38425|nr:BAG family molecular chaperone regulator 4-like [Prosopis alba]
MNQTSLPAQKDESLRCDMRPGEAFFQGPKVVVEDDGNIASSSPVGPMIKISVSHGSSLHELQLPAQSTFRDVKKLLVQRIGLDPQGQRLFFRGKEKDDEEQLHTEGVKDKSKILLLDDANSREKKHEEIRNDKEISKASEAVAGVRAEVDKLSERVGAIKMAVDGGHQVSEQEFLVSTELLMRQLLKLDGIEAEGEAKSQRKAEVSRVQNYVDTLDSLKARNANPFHGFSNAVAVTTKWETFDPEEGNVNAPTSTSSSSTSTKVTQDWEQFD